MRLRSLGKTGLQCSELGLGTWGLSGAGYGAVHPDEQDRVIARARALGITLFETADSYGDGAMEERLARILGNDDRCCVVTKIGTQLDADPPRKRFDSAYLEEALRATLGRLHPRAPDVVLLHNPSLEAILRGDASALLAERTRAGVIRSWGVSAGSAEVARAAIDCGAPVVELAFNVLWTDVYRFVEQRATEEGVGILARSVLAHGLLGGFWSPDRTFPEGDHRSERWTSDDLGRRVRQLDALRPLLRGEVSTMRAAALRWVLHHDAVNSAVLGPRSCLQLDQLVREAGKAPPYLPADTIEPLEQRLKYAGARS